MAGIDNSEYRPSFPGTENGYWKPDHKIDPASDTSLTGEWGSEITSRYHWIGKGDPDHSLLPGSIEDYHLSDGGKTAIGKETEEIPPSVQKYKSESSCFFGDLIDEIPIPILLPIALAGEGVKSLYKGAKRLFKHEKKDEEPA